jgi:hypothetical protein
LNEDKYNWHPDNDEMAETVKQIIEETSEMQVVEIEVVEMPSSQDFYQGIKLSHEPSVEQPSTPPPQRDEYARCEKCGGAQGYGSAMHGGGLCNCTPQPAQPGEAKPVQPWMEAAAQEINRVQLSRNHVLHHGNLKHPIMRVEEQCRIIAAHAPSSSASEYESAGEFFNRVYKAPCVLPFVPTMSTLEFAERYSAERQPKRRG